MSNICSNSHKSLSDVNSKPPLNPSTNTASSNSSIDSDSKPRAQSKQYTKLQRSTTEKQKSSSVISEDEEETTPNFGSQPTIAPRQQQRSAGSRGQKSGLQGAVFNKSLSNVIAQNMVQVQARSEGDLDAKKDKPELEKSLSKLNEDTSSPNVAPDNHPPKDSEFQDEEIDQLKDIKPLTQKQPQEPLKLTPDIPSKPPKFFIPSNNVLYDENGNKLIKISNPFEQGLYSRRMKRLIQPRLYRSSANVASNQDDKPIESDMTASVKRSFFATSGDQTSATDKSVKQVVGELRRDSSSPDIRLQHYDSSTGLSNPVNGENNAPKLRRRSSSFSSLEAGPATQTQGISSLNGSQSLNLNNAKTTSKFEPDTLNGTRRSLGSLTYIGGDIFDTVDPYRYTLSSWGKKLEDDINKKLFALDMKWRDIKDEMDTVTPYLKAIFELRKQNTSESRLNRQGYTSNTVFRRRGSNMFDEDSKAIGRKQSLAASKMLNTMKTNTFNMEEEMSKLRGSHSNLASEPSDTPDQQESTDTVQVPVKKGRKGLFLSSKYNSTERRKSSRPLDFASLQFLTKQYFNSQGLEVEVTAMRDEQGRKLSDILAEGELTESMQDLKVDEGDGTSASNSTRASVANNPSNTEGLSATSTKPQKQHRVGRRKKSNKFQPPLSEIDLEEQREVEEILMNEIISKKNYLRAEQAEIHSLQKEIEYLRRYEETVKKQ